MKYITTDKHPELKGGLILEFAENKSCLLLNYTGFYLEVGINETLEKGYIKELQEKEFTEDDMIDFVHWAVRNYSEPYYNIIMARSDFNKWKKQNYKL